MAGTEGFVLETNNSRVQRGFTVLIIVLFIIMGVVAILANTGTQGSWYERFAPDLTGNIAPLQVFYLSTFGSMIFFPIPAEMAFYFSVKQGYPVALLIFLGVLGFVIGNFVNYLVGLKFHRQILYILSAKKFYALRRKVNRWGAVAVFVANAVPSPSDLITFGLGTVRYNRKRLLMLTAVGNFVKFCLIAAAVYLLHGVVTP